MFSLSLHLSLSVPLLRFVALSLSLWIFENNLRSPVGKAGLLSGCAGQHGAPDSKSAERA